MITFRKLINEDIEEVALLIPRVYKEFNKAESTPKRIKAFSDSLDPAKHTHNELIKKLKQPITYAAEENGKIIGIIRGNPDRITSLFVEGDYHSKGIGKKLFVLFKKEAIKSGSKSIKVRASLLATDFYEKLGFKKTTGERQFEGMALQPLKKML